MKKHKLERLANFSAVFAIGTLCVFSSDQAEGQALPPIIRSSATKLAAPQAGPKPVVPLIVSQSLPPIKSVESLKNSPALPPIVKSGQQLANSAGPSSAGPNGGSSVPVGSGTLLSAPARDLVTEPLLEVQSAQPARSRGLFSSLFARKKNAKSQQAEKFAGSVSDSGRIAPIASTVDENASKVAQATAIQSNAAESYRIARAAPPAPIVKEPVLRTPLQGSGARNAIQGSGTRSVLDAFDSGLPGAGPLTGPNPPIVSGTLVSPQAGQPLPSGSAAADQFTSPRFVDGGTGQDPTFFDAVPAQDSSVVGPSVVSHDHGSGSGCESCGPGGCYDSNRINCDYGTFGSVSAASRYANFDFLYYTREDGDINNSNFNPLGDFDGAPGWRVTLGARQDRLMGREISYFGVSPIETSSTTTDPQNRLNALFVPTGGLAGGDISSFFNAETQTQFKDSVIHSIESNRVRWGWDVLKSFVGWRYIYFSDDYELNSTAPVLDGFGNTTGTESGRFRLDTNNHLIGGHIGAEVFYDVGFRLSLSVISKFGVFANINKVDYFLENDGLTVLDSEDDGATFATNYELGIMAHYQIRQSARIRVGYNGFFLGNVATVSDNFSGVVTPFTGFDGSDSDDAFIHGLSVGLEIFR